MKSFFFFQTSVDCIEGNKIRSFYKVEDFPYVAIIDPRTGEEQKSYRGPFQLTVEEFCKEIYTFLHDNFTPDYIVSKIVLFICPWLMRFMLFRSRVQPHRNYKMIHKIQYQALHRRLMNRPT